MLAQKQTTVRAVQTRASAVKPMAALKPVQQKKLAAGLATVALAAAVAAPVSLSLCSVWLG